MNRGFTVILIMLYFTKSKDRQLNAVLEDANTEVRSTHATHCTVLVAVLFTLIYLMTRQLVEFIQRRME
jgi:hypothetical protein